MWYKKILFVCGLVLCLLGLASQEAKAADAKMNIYAIDLGKKEKGDATLIESKGEYLLVDTGSKGNVNKVVEFLNKKHVTHLSILLTHFHTDHAGGLMTILEKFTVDHLYVQERNVLVTTVSESQNAKDISSAEKSSMKGMVDRYDALVVKSKKYTTGMFGFTMHTLKKGSSFTFGDAFVSVLGPVKLFHLSDMKKRKTVSDEPRSERAMNNNCLVFTVKSGNTTFLCGADLEKEGEQAILKSGVNLKADIFKMNHHGTDTSNIPAFLKRVAPKYSWSSYYSEKKEIKKQNQVYKKKKAKVRASDAVAGKTVYGFIRTYDNMREADKYGEVYRTQFNGDITFSVNNDVITDFCNTGFRTIDGATYLYVNGKKRVGKIKDINQSFYKTDAEGRIQTGLFHIGKKFYYCFGTHGMAMMGAGYVKYKGKKYHTNDYVPYLDTGWTKVNRKKVYFNPKTAVYVKTK